MTKNLKSLVYFFLIALVFSVSQKIWCTEEQDGKASFVSSRLSNNVNTFVKLPDNEQVVMKLNPEEFLSDLRVELAKSGKITDDDVFLYNECDVLSNDEANWVIKEVINKDNTLFLKPRNSVFSQVADLPSAKFVSQKREGWKSWAARQGYYAACAFWTKAILYDSHEYDCLEHNKFVKTNEGYVVMTALNLSLMYVVFYPLYCGINRIYN